MNSFKSIATTLAVLGTGAIMASGCKKDSGATETPAGSDAAAEAPAAEASCGGEEKAEGSCGGAEGSCGGAEEGEAAAEPAPEPEAE